MLGRWMAADLYLRDVENAADRPVHAECNGPLRKRVGDDPEPYRALLRDVRERLLATRAWAEALDPVPSPEVYHTTEDLYEPLALCDASLRDVGMEIIADGPLKDTLRRVKAFGVTLVNLDIRQTSDRHGAALDEVTRYLGVDGRPAATRTGTRRSGATSCSTNSRAAARCFPRIGPSAPSRGRVLDTCAVVAEQNGDGISEYIVSRARAPSDVLAAVLLLRESGLRANLPIVPLFETLDDLDRAAGAIDALHAIDWYAEYAGGEQQVMIGYSDSAKDAGMMAASWALYRFKERLAEVAESRGFRLSLFHGPRRAPSGAAASSGANRPSSPSRRIRWAGDLRVTEQGETIRSKLGDNRAPRGKR